MDVDISRAVDARVASVFRPADIYFAPYGNEEVHEIMKTRVMQGLFQGVLSDELLDLVVKQTLSCGDLRVGIDLLKRATLSAERAARHTIGRDDICGAYEVSKYLHLSYTLKTLKDEERLILKSFAERSAKEHEMNAGEVYKSIRESLSIGYTRFYEIIKKMDAMRLINLQYRDGKGRTRIITLRYDPAKVLEYLG
jgi:cell division control protein 6